MIFASLVVVGAGPGQSSGTGMTFFLMQMLAIVAIFYFLIIRPKMKQEKRHRERLEAIKQGDEIVTAGGIIAKVVHVKDKQLTVKSGDTRLLVQRDRVAVVHGPGERTEANQ